MIAKMQNRPCIALPLSRIPASCCCKPASNTTALTTRPPPLKSPAIQRHCRLARPATHRRPELPKLQARKRNGESQYRMHQHASLPAATRPLLFLHRPCLAKLFERASIVALTMASPDRNCSANQKISAIDGSGVNVFLQPIGNKNNTRRRYRGGFDG
jgi:hypothetical protein